MIGPLAKNQHDMLGPWWGGGDDADAVTVFDGIDEQNTAATTYAEGCKLSNAEVPAVDGDGCGSEADFTEAGRRRERGRPGRARSGRDARDERRGERPAARSTSRAGRRS